MHKGTLSYLIFNSGRGLYGIPAKSAAEVVHLTQITRIPGAPRHLLGVFAHRGEVVPLIDLSSLIGTPAESASRAVLLRLEVGSVAFVAQRVAGVIPLVDAEKSSGGQGIWAHINQAVLSEYGEVSTLEIQGLYGFLKHLPGFT